ncbi:MAG: DUF2127 domain-containing protein [Actinomycetota bacterium]
MAFKFLSGTAEFAAGLSLLILPPSLLTIIFNLASAEEMREDPTDAMVLFIQHRLPQLLGTKHMFAIGLILLGMVKIVGSVGLLRRKAWAYKLLVVILVALIPFDAFHLANKMSALSLGLFAANVLVLGLLLLFRKTLASETSGS